VTGGISEWTQEHGASSGANSILVLGTTRILHRAIQTGIFMDSVHFYTTRTLTKTSTEKGDSRL